MVSLAKVVELASQQADDSEFREVFHGNVMWFGADGSAKLIHEECESVVEAPPELWVTFLMCCHPPLGED